MLVRNEDVFLEQAIRNVAAFCDRVHVLDHLSTDGTADVLRRLASELDHLDVVRSPDAGDSHRALAPYFGTPTWVLGVDGDELFDPLGLAALRSELQAGAFDEFFRVRGWVLHCDELDLEHCRARGYLGPPARPVTKLYNLGTVDGYSPGPERLHWTPLFRPGYDMRSILDFPHTVPWEDDPLRMVHACFLPRSSADPGGATERANLAETGAYRRSVVRRLRRRWRPYVPGREMQDTARRGVTWKRDKYARGPRAYVDARPFFDLGGSADGVALRGPELRRGGVAEGDEVPLGEGLQRGG